MRIGFFTTRMMLGYGVDLTVDQLAWRLVEQHGHSVDVWTPTSDGTYENAPYSLRKLYVYGAPVNRALPLLELNAWIALRKLRAEGQVPRASSKALAARLRLAGIEDEELLHRLDTADELQLVDAIMAIADRYPSVNLGAWPLASGPLYDLVIPCTHPYYSAGAALGCPSIFFNFGNVPTTGFSWKGRLNWRWLEFSDEYLWKPRSACVLSISRFLHRQQRPELQARGRVLHLGGDHYAWRDIPLDDPRRAEARLKFRLDFGIPPRSIALGYCGRLHRDHPPYKGTAQLLELAQRLRTVVGTEAVVVLCGIGSKSDAQWIQAAGGAPILNLPPKLMPDFYNALDVYVCASQWEGFNLPIVEAAWHGVPSLAYDVGAHAEHVTSMLIPAHNFDGFTAAAIRLVRDEALRQRLGQAAWQRAQRFSWDNAALQLNTLLRELKPC